MFSWTTARGCLEEAGGRKKRGCWLVSSCCWSGVGLVGRIYQFFLAFFRSFALPTMGTVHKWFPSVTDAACHDAVLVLILAFVWSEERVMGGVSHSASGPGRGGMVWGVGVGW